MSIAIVEVQVFSLAPRQKGNNGALAEKLGTALQKLLDGSVTRVQLYILANGLGPDSFHKTVETGAIPVFAFKGQ